MASRRLLALLLAVLAAASAHAEERVENWPAGPVRRRYEVNELGDRHGPYLEYHENSAIKVRARYVDGELEGPYLAYSESGVLVLQSHYHRGELQGNYTEKYETDRIRVRTAYKRGERHGAYVEFHPDGLTERVRATYVEGERDGPYREWDGEGRLRVFAEYAEGRLHGRLEKHDAAGLLTSQVWERGRLVTLEGVVAYPRELDEIRRTLAALEPLCEPVKPSPEGPPPPSAEEAEARRADALRRLKAYRFLSGVPWEDLELDDAMNRHAQAAAELCRRIGRLDHTPENPGLPKPDYEFAYRGTSSSNLAIADGLVGAVDGYMDDSDPSNIDRVGHRRWCLNPPLLRTGFGETGRFSAMWSMDRSRRPVPRIPVVTWPPAGYVPARYFGPRIAWSASLDPRDFEAPQQDQVTVTLRRVGEDHVRDPEPIPLDHFGVQTSGAGLPYCVIFRPAELDLAPGSRYWVEIAGLVRKGADPSAPTAPLRWLVEFSDRL